jgi:hypothetical protein
MAGYFLIGLPASPPIVFLLKKRQETGMSLWFSHPLFLPSLIIAITIVLWATSLLPEFMTALLFFAAAMIAKIAPPEAIFGGFASSHSGWYSAASSSGLRFVKPGWRTGRRRRYRRD